MGEKLKRYKLSEEEKKLLLDVLREELMKIDDIVFAYVHGGFIELDSFRDIDVAIWIKRSELAFNYTIKLSVKLEDKLRLPVDVHVLNEAPLPFKYHVFTRGRLLLSKDENLRLKLIDNTIREYVDVKYLHEYTLK